ncbi:hypothetical protein HAX54_031491 [Datura stramonium]|uniref:Uncharacterized protein n=1 Tax=Datura stramonium TaxID=4076 RepID=A0ABS8VBU8_DATST|nr:hypothetical protein [Datura stramonium]
MSTHSGDLVRLPSTRKSTKKVMKEVLKDNQVKTAQRRKLKNRVIVEEEVQPENVLYHEGGETEKDIDDDIAIRVMLIREKALSQYYEEPEVDAKSSKPKRTRTGEGFVIGGPGSRSLIVVLHKGPVERPDLSLAVDSYKSTNVVYEGNAGEEQISNS